MDGGDGSDALTPLAYLAAVTKRIRLGTGIMQLAARTPAAAAMAVGTIDALAGGGRVIAGLGVSGPQIVEGWYGQPWGKPYWRLRDYVAIMRKVFARKSPVQHEGRDISLPCTGPGSAGLAKPLTSILHMRRDIPIWLGTGGEFTVKLTAEVADGWLPLPRWWIRSPSETSRWAACAGRRSACSSPTWWASPPWPRR
jgi:alkanesulfonate monooxygenase SsuD/methylene tetrahydromethanopterin reductase-like flavin-dependent oxidoreductase (luciferase family)